MAQKDAKIKFLERELAEKEREIDTMKDIEIPVVESPKKTGSPDINDRLNRLEAMVKGLTEEMLDIRSIVDKLWDGYEVQQKAARSSRHEAKNAVEGPSSSKKPAENRSEARPTAVAAKDDDEGTELIMQVDGTLKREKRTSKEYIVAETSAMNMGPQNRKKAGTIIYAEEDDSKFIRGKKRS